MFLIYGNRLYVFLFFFQIDNLDRKLEVLQNWSGFYKISPGVIFIFPHLLLCVLSQMPQLCTNHFLTPGQLHIHLKVTVWSGMNSNWIVGHLIPAKPMKSILQYAAVAHYMLQGRVWLVNSTWKNILKNWFLCNMALLHILLLLFMVCWIPNSIGK